MDGLPDVVFAALCSCCRVGLAAVSELLSTAASLKGFTLIRTSHGDVQAYKAAMKEFLSSVR